MAFEVREFTVTVTAGTQIAAPQLTAMTMPARIVRKVRVRVPPGPNGNVGFALAAAGVPIVPYNTGAWIVADNEILEWELEGQITSGAWQLRAYNTGAYDHTLYVVFELDIPQRSGIVVAPVAPLIVSPAEVGSVFSPSPVAVPPPEVDGYALARDNAVAAIETALGLAVDVTPGDPPEPGTVAATAYDAGRRAALAALAAV